MRRLVATMGFLSHPLHFSTLSVHIPPPPPVPWPPDPSSQGCGGCVISRPWGPRVPVQNVRPSRCVAWFGGSATVHPWFSVRSSSRQPCRDPAACLRTCVSAPACVPSRLRCRRLAPNLLHRRTGSFLQPNRSCALAVVADYFISGRGPPDLVVLPLCFSCFRILCGTCVPVPSLGWVWLSLVRGGSRRDEGTSHCLGVHSACGEPARGRGPGHPA